MSSNSRTLWDLGAGSKATVANYTDALPSNYRLRLEELGFLPGSEVSCVMRPSLGAPRLYQLDNTVYSLDANIAKQLLIEA